MVLVLVRKYSQIIQRYYVQYLRDFDAITLNQRLHTLTVCPEDESLILSSLANDIANLSVKQSNFCFLSFLEENFFVENFTSNAKATPSPLCYECDVA